VTDTPGAAATTARSGTSTGSGTGTGTDAGKSTEAASSWARSRPGQAASGWSLQRRLTLAFAVAGVLFSAFGVTFGFGLASMVSAVNVQVNRLDPVLRYTSYEYNALINEETGVRGYTITRQRDFLQPYNQGSSDAPADEAMLRNLAAPYPALMADLKVMLDRADRWHNDFAIPTIAAVGRNASISVAQEQTGKAEFNAFRTSVKTFTDEATKERAAALNRLHAAITSTIIEAIVAGLLLIATAVAAWIGLALWVRRPLGSLRREAQTVASGDPNHEVEITGSREIRELASDVEAMRRQLIASLDEASFKASELQRSNRELEQFAYVASHDLQEPLRKVASFCQMLESRYADQLDERAKQYIAYAVDGAKRMQVLINDLLAFSRVGQPGAALRPVDLNEAAGQAVSELEAAIEDSDAVITVDHLPVLNGDRTLLIQLFANLMGNSIKFRRVDSPPVIRITAERKDGLWEFSCQDNGIGIDPAYGERVFVIFQRLHPRDAYPGTGIGLALCRKIVDFHGGKIWVDDQPRTTPGTTIRWTLPADLTRQGGSGGF
jgi:signal transduction histidine kinase